MTGCDPGLKMISTQCVPGGGHGQILHAASNQRLIPNRAILLLEAKHVSFRIGPRGQARGVEQHQRDQGMSARLISSGMFRQQRSQTNRFLAKFFSDQMIAAGRLVAFVEKKVERLQDTIEAPRQFFASWYLKWNVLIANLLFGPRQSLGNSRFGG